MRDPTSDIQGRSSRPSALLAIAVFLAYLLSSSLRFPLGGDGYQTLATSRSLVTHLTLAVDKRAFPDEGYGRAHESALIGARTPRWPASDCRSSKCRLLRQL
jgi:hypothetical protein